MQSLNSKIGFRIFPFSINKLFSADLRTRMSKNQPTIVALIPARSGSKRVPDKNIRPLAGHPLIAYTIAAARQSEIFTDVIVSTDSKGYADIAGYYGAEVPFLRPAEIAGDHSSDIEWLASALRHLQDEGREYDCFSILRPTSPFRLPGTIQRAWQAFLAEMGVDSLRAVEKCTQHPGKMWVVQGRRMTPLLPLGPAEQPWHSSQYPSLPEVYVQNASLEIAWSRVVLTDRTITGNVVMPFFTTDYEGFDVNNEYDWQLAEHTVQKGDAKLPHITQPAYSR
jgi:CMP-N,N'-diacetyllegionaminic acid synthase